MAAPVALQFDTSPRFEFTLPGSDKVWSLPNLQDLPIGLRQRLATAGKPVFAARKAGRKPSDAALTRLGETQLEMLEAGAPGLTDALPVKALAVLITQWSEFSGISLGE